MKSARCILVILICLSAVTVRAAGIVGTGSTSEDSVSISVFVTDSLGNPARTQADSFFVHVIGPAGDSTAGIAGVAATSSLHIDSMQTTLAGWTYVYAEAVNVIDGTGRPGIYELCFCAKDNAPEYYDCARRTFQISGDHLSSQLAAITTILDSVLAVLDTVQNQDDWISSVTEQSIADAVWDEDTAGHGINGSFALLVKDTAAYQGNASGLTAAEVADSVWDEAHGDHLMTGSFGSYLDAPISGAGSPLGSGTYPVTIVAYDSSGGQAVPGARVYAYDESVQVLMAAGATAPDGHVAFNLDPGDYVLSCFAPGYLFAAYDTVVVAGAETDTVCAHRFDPGSPSAPNLCRVYGFIYSVDGRPLEGITVGAEIADGVVRYNSLIISPYRQTTTSDTAGYFYFDLIPSDDLNPTGTSYLITASSGSGTILNTQIMVPDASDWQLDW